MSESLVRLVELPVISDPRGNLCVVESSRTLPFDIARVYFLYDVPSGSTRAGHAHRSCLELLLPLSGSFNVRLWDGVREDRVLLNRPNVGLLIDTMVWRELDEFSAGSVCLVLTSELFDEADYIRDRDEFVRAARR